MVMTVPHPVSLCVSAVFDPSSLLPSVINDTVSDTVYLIKDESLL